VFIFAYPIIATFHLLRVIQAHRNHTETIYPVKLLTNKAVSFLPHIDPDMGNCLWLEGLHK